MYWKYIFNRLQLYHYLIFNEQIHPKTLVKMDTIKFK